VLCEADELCLSRIARFFDRRVVQSILRKAGDRAANLRVQLPRVLIAATRLWLGVRSRSGSMRVWKQ
jgi:hypothetical protein